MVRPEKITAMNLVHLEFEALKILTTLEEMNSDKVATAIARALADALADAAEASGSAAEIAA
jgi:phosphate-selective porin